MNKSGITSIGSIPIELDFSCLIEREEALLKVQNFFEMLTVKERGILRVVGSYGTGRTRFLNEIAKKASEFGFERGFIEVKEELLAQAAAASENSDIWNLEKSVAKDSNDLNINGIILIIDDALNMNDEDIDFVYGFLKCKIPIKIGLVYSIEPDTIFGLDYFDIDLCDTVCINPLSPKGIQRWIENVLDWEGAPPAFLQWLYKETKGLPKLLQENVNSLIKNGFLICSPNNHWMVSGNFSGLNSSNINDDQSGSLRNKRNAFHTERFENELKLTCGMGQLWNSWRYWNESLTRLKEIINRQETFSKLENVKLYIWFGSLIELEGDYEKALIVLDEGLEFFRRSIDKEGEAEIFYLKALAVSTHGDLKKMSVLLQKSLDIYRSMNDKPGMTRVLQYLGMVYYYRGEYDKAEVLLVESFEICKKSKDLSGISNSLLRLGIIARGKGDLTQALKLFYEYLKQSDQFYDNESISIALINIAEIYIRQEDYSFAENVYEKSLKLLHEMGYKILIARVFKDLAQFARYEGNYDRANRLFAKSLDVLEKCDDDTEIMWLYLSMAEMELGRQNYSAAKDMYIKGLKIFRESNKTNWLYAMAVFEALADISYFQEEMTRAAKLMGAADKLSEVSEKFIAKNDFAEIYTRHKKLREKMKRETFEMAWSEGNIMNFEEAINFAIDEDNDKSNDDMAEKMINYIKANYSRDISLTDIAEYFNMSPCYLSTMFKHYTGENFKDYLNYYRVKKAKEYLQKGKMKMGTVAKLVGCNSINTFIRIFKKYEGVPPGQFGMKNSN